MKLLLNLFPLILPLAVKWVEREERKILKHGIPLSAGGLLDASHMGVADPAKIRLMKVERIPVLNGAMMEYLSRFVPTISSTTVGLSLRYGIYIRARYWGDRQLVAHECVHTGQYERHGNIREFLRAYFTECIEIGYPDSPMEQEAILRSAVLSGNEQEL